MTGMDNRSIILSTALELFAARGYDGVGVQEVAEAAGITKPTLYHYFGSKLGLLKAAYETYHSQFNQEVQAAVDYQGDLPLTLEKVARAFFNFARQHPVFYRLRLALFVAPQGGEANQAADRWNESLWQMIETMFAAAVANHGNMRGRQKIYTATYIGMLDTCISLWLNGTIELDDLLLRQVVHQFQHGIYS